MVMDRVIQDLDGNLMTVKAITIDQYLCSTLSTATAIKHIRRKRYSSTDRKCFLEGHKNLVNRSWRLEVLVESNKLINLVKERGVVVQR